MGLSLSRLRIYFRRTVRKKSTKQCILVAYGEPTKIECSGGYWRAPTTCLRGQSIRRVVRFHRAWGGFCKNRRGHSRTSLYKSNALPAASRGNRNTARRFSLSMKVTTWKKLFGVTTKQSFGPADPNAASETEITLADDPAKKATA